MKRVSFKEVLLNVFFPSRCPWCDRVQGFANTCTCGPTLAKLRLPAAPRTREEHEGLYASLAEVWAAFYYESPVKEACHRLKFENEEALAGLMGREMAFVAEAAKLAECFDLMVPVPVSPGTLQTRGYNQSALLAREVARHIALPVEENVLIKTKENQKQMSLHREARLENPNGVYEVQQADLVKEKRLLLVDDILTTGGTLAETSRVLLKAGAKSCGGLTLAAVAKLGVGRAADKE